jgi:hypothetical protein
MFIPTSNYSARYGGRVRLAIIHTTEGALDVVSLGHFFQTGTKNASYHSAVDNNKQYAAYVDYSNASWSTLSANGFSDSMAMCCSAVASNWSLADWQAHPNLLELCAAWIADRCTARGLPIRRLSIPEIQACHNNPSHPGGVIMHHDWTVAVEGTHSDCGSTFPWDSVLQRAREIAGQVTPVAPVIPGANDEEMDMQNLPISGAGHTVLVTPTGKASSNNRQVWVSVACDGPGHFRMYAQNETGGVNDWTWDIAPSADNTMPRAYTELKDGTTKLVAQWDLKNGACGCICLETRPRQ